MTLLTQLDSANKHTGLDFDSLNSHFMSLLGQLGQGTLSNVSFLIDACALGAVDKKVKKKNQTLKTNHIAAFQVLSIYSGREKEGE